MHWLLRTLLMTGWLASFALTNLHAQLTQLAADKPEGLKLVQEAQEAYRRKDLGQAVSLAQRAISFLEFCQEKHVWCMVLQMSVNGKAMAAETGTQHLYPSTVDRSEARFLSKPTHRNAKALIDTYLKASKQANNSSNPVLAMGWKSTSFCLSHHYDPVRETMIQNDLFSGIEKLAKQVLAQKEKDLSPEEKALKEQERQAVYVLFKQIGIEQSRTTMSKSASDGKPVDWEEGQKKVVNLYGANSLEEALTLKAASNFYQASGNTKTADEKLRKAISILKPKRSEYAPQLLSCYVDMALLSLQMGRYDSVSTAIRETYPLLTSQNRLNMSMSVSGRRKELYALANTDMRSLIAFAACVSPHKTDPLLQEIAYDAMLYLSGLLLDDSRQLRATLHHQLAQVTNPNLPKLYANWLTQRKAFLNAPATEREKAGEAIATAEARLVKELRPETNTPNRGTDLTWKQVQAKLRPTEAAVSFVRFMTMPAKNNARFPLRLPTFDTTSQTGEWLYAAMVVRPGYAYPRLAVLGSEQALKLLLKKAKTPTELYSKTRGPGFKNSTYADSLYRFVWKPIETWMVGADSIYVSTEGLISQLALAALPLPTTTRTTPVYERYLSSRHYLNHVFEMRQVAQGIRPLRLTNQTTITLLGDIDFEHPTESTDNPTTPTYLQAAIAQRGLVPLNPLRATGPEVSAIASLLPNNSLLRERDATEVRFRQLMAKPPTLLHIATHGIYLPYRADADSAEALIYSDDALTRSALALSGANQLWHSNSPVGAAHDGLLTAYEIADLDLSQTRLAVLSACETGLGDIGLFASSEGLLGLQRGFRLAGVEKMIVSLWSVDDERTQQFMNTFYTALKAGSEVRTAFRQAQATLQTTDDPAYWAAFVLIE
ncbi:hypothetical protein GCM10028805_07140 [Spirosoma harenae]